MKNKKFFKRSLSLLMAMLMSASLMLPTYAIDNSDEPEVQSSVAAVVPSDADSSAPDASADAEAQDAEAPDASVADDAAETGDEDLPGDTSAVVDEPQQGEPEQGSDAKEGDNDAPAEVNTEIVSFNEYPATITAERTTLAEIAAQLPTQIEATLADGSVITLDATWSCSEVDTAAYEADPAAVEGLVYTLNIPEGYTLSESVAEWDVPTIVVTLVDADQSDYDIPAGRAYLIGNYGKAYVNNGDVAALSNIGDAVYIERGESIAYEGYTTYKYTAKVGNNSYLCFCAEPSKSSTTGWYTVSKLDPSSEIGKLVLSVMICGYGGPLYEEVGKKDWFADEMADFRKYGYTHAALGRIYSGSTKGLTSNVVTWTYNVEADINKRLADPDSSLSKIIGNYTAYIAYNSAGQDMVWMEENPHNTTITLNKTSSVPSITSGNSSYSLQGAVYGVYSDAACTTEVTTITTGANGKGVSAEIPQTETYYVKEKTASKGYELDKTVYTVDASAETATLNVTETPANDPLTITLTKITDVNTTNIPSLAGAQFTINYYDGQYSSVGQLPSKPTRSWVIQTTYNANTGKYNARLSNAYKVSGDDFYYIDGAIVLPVGTITVQETKAPADYTLSGSYINDKSGNTVSDSNGVVLLNVTQTGLGSVARLNGGNEYTKTDSMIRGGVQIRKLDGDNHTGAQGNATLAGAKYDIISLNDYDVEVNSKIYTKDQTVLTLTTDVNGYASTTTTTLPAGQYKVVEKQSPTGYQLSGTVEYTFTVTQQNTLVDLTRVLSDKVIRGGVSISKYDTDNNAAEAQGNATLAGAKFEILNDSNNSVIVQGHTYKNGEVVATITTDANGVAKTASDLLPYGNYIIREAEGGQPNGYTHEGVLSQKFSITQNGVVVLSAPISNDVIRGGVKLYKYDADTHEHEGQVGATVSGATFEIINRSDKPVVVNGTKYAPGAVVYTGQTNADGLFETASDLLPYGHYEVCESKAPSGYTTDGTTSQFFDITEDGVVVDMTAFEDSISNRVIRGDFELRKVDGDDQTEMAGVVFKITSNATGESHTFVTDANGYYNSSADWIPHTQDTNGGTVESGLWFGSATPDDNAGALPFGVYTIEEQHCDANKDYVLWTGTLTISRDGYTVNFNNVENFKMRLNTSAVFEDTGTQYSGASSDVTIVDTITYENLIPKTDYTMVGILMNKANGESVKDANGNEVIVTREFHTTTRSGSMKMEFNFDASALAGADVVVFEHLYMGHGDAMSEEPVISHADITDENQTVHFPEIHTSVLDTATGTNVSYGETTITLVDTVSYSNLQVGKNYTVTGTLMDKETGKPVYDVNGQLLTATTSFKATATAGTVDVTFVFNGTVALGKQIVCFETLKWYDHIFATHADINDEAQTDYVPAIGTTALDGASNTHNVLAGAQAVIVDTVSYKGLKPGVSYTVKGVLADTKTGATMKDAAGNDIIAEATFTPTETKGTVDVTFRFDASNLAGATGVVLERLYLGGDKLVAEHTDLTDAEQTIKFPEIHTTATDIVTGGHMADANGNATITDKVEYSNLIVGQTYTMTGTLYNKATGAKLVNEDGSDVTASKTFTAEAESGSIELTFTFDASALAGETVVAFETLYINDVPVGIHADINDEQQSVHFPELHTSAADSETETDLAMADSEITINDTVTYANVIAGEKYTVKGILMDATTGEAALDANGSQITSEASFTADETAGSVVVTFTFDGSNLANHTLVVFETLYWADHEIGSHKDINDAGQTIHIPEIGTTALDAETNDHIGLARENGTLVDTVAYKNLVVGKTYTMTGTLYLKSTGKPITDAEGNAYTATATFTPAAADGSIDLTFHGDFAALAGDSIVVFEDCAYNGVTIANHEDINDEGQTVHLPELHTTALDKESGTHNAMADSDVTIIDTVNYKNLIPGKEYTVNGKLVDKATGDVLIDAQGNEVTASATFTADEADGSIELTFHFDGSLLEGKTVVAFESLLYQGVEVGIHADIDDEEQSIHFPKIRTTAVEKEDGEHITRADAEVTLSDTVNYENLIPGQKYTMTATVMIKSTGEALLDKGGNPVTASTEFTAEAANGSVELSVTVDATALAGDSVVFYESLTINGVEVGVHADIDDETQTVHFPKIGTTALDGETNDHIGLAREDTVIVDTVEYTNLIPGVEYTMTGTLYSKNDKMPIGNADGVYTASVTFTPGEPDGSVELTFHFNSDLDGDSIVVFESLKYKGVEIANHKDLDDENQTVHYPEVKTTIEDVESGTHNANADSSVTLKDSVHYKNLIAGKVYTVSGKLMVKSTGKELLDADGEPITASVTFTPDAPDGSIDLTFHFDGSLLAGESVVAFERISYNGIDIGIHEDLDDEDQTIHFIKVSTTATEKEKGEHITMAGDKVTLVDSVKLENLIVGQEYTVKAQLMGVSTEKVLGAAEKTFTADAVNMTVELEVTLDASALAGQSVVFFETVYTNGAEVGSHADLEDEGQTVHFPEIRTNAIDKESGTHSSIADDDVTIVDTVTYKNLIPGKEYTVNGKLMNKATGEVLLDAQGKEVTATATFTPDEADGSIDLTFHFDASHLAADGAQVVAFESLTHKGIEIGVHADINDAAQTVVFPAIHTNATIAGTDGKQEIEASGVITINDVVSYTNLTPGQEYTLVGYLINKENGNIVIGVDGYACISQVTFTPDAADGEITVSFEFDTAQYGGQAVVVFETLYKGTDLTAQPVARHCDLEDANQTVNIIAPPPTPSTITQTGDTAMPILFVGIALVAAIALVVLCVARKRRNEQQQ